MVELDQRQQERREDATQIRDEGIDLGDRARTVLKEILDVVDGRYTYVNRPLAELYGLKNVPFNGGGGGRRWRGGDEFVRVGEKAYAEIVQVQTVNIGRPRRLRAEVFIEKCPALPCSGASGDGATRYTVDICEAALRPE